jgi:hypothetical protein
MLSDAYLKSPDSLWQRNTACQNSQIFVKVQMTQPMEKFHLNSYRDAVRFGHRKPGTLFSSSKSELKADQGFIARAIYGF